MACEHVPSCMECLMAEQIAGAPRFDLHADCKAERRALVARADHFRESCETWKQQRDIAIEQRNAATERAEAAEEGRDWLKGELEQAQWGASANYERAKAAEKAEAALDALLRSTTVRAISAEQRVVLLEAEVEGWRNRATALCDFLAGQGQSLHGHARHGRRERHERGIILDWRDCTNAACHTTRLLLDSVRAALADAGGRP